MEFLRNLLLFLHFVGLASLLGGCLVQMKAIRGQTLRILPAMVHGAYTQLLTGLLLVAVIQMGHLAHINNAKVGLKLVIAFVITFLIIKFKRSETVSKNAFLAITCLTVANVAIAVFWH